MKAIIQAGGKGTRINSITGGLIPKPMLEVSGFPILFHQIMNLKKSGITEIILIVGYLGNIIKDYFGTGEKLGIKIEYFEEDPEKPLGTAGALYYLKEKITEDFIFLLADVFIDIDFNRMIEFHHNKKSDITLLTHPNAHPFDSDLVIVDQSDKVLGFDYKTNDRSSYFYHNLVNAGIMIFSAESLDLLVEEGKYSYEKDVIVPLISRGNVYSYKSTEYAKDMGTPERYEMVKHDYQEGLCSSRNLVEKQKCVFLDRDGTINKYVGFLKSTDKFELLPKVSEAIKRINQSGYLCVVVTNQPIIARGDATVETLDDIHKKMETLLGQEGAYIDELYYCPHHPDKGFPGEIAELKIKCDCRKPNIGMINKAVEKFNINLEESFMIGDSTSDIQCAKNAGIRSILVKTGEAGLDCKYDSIPDFIAEDLYEAIEIIINNQEKILK